MADFNNIKEVKIETDVTDLQTSANKTSSAGKREYDDIISGNATTDTIKKFGITHYRYKDCAPADITSVDKCYVHKDCAAAFKAMRAEAAKSGLKLKIVSGYRSSEYQKQVFKRKFNGKYPTADQMQSRLKYSAPSGYSEHHTGLAIDINETEETFKNTKEYEWLLAHAKDYGFEISFPKNNDQSLGFEPWHWRYVGKDGEYKHIFANARKNDKRFVDEYK